MVLLPPPMSNAERQRQFRERNPGYYGRLMARRRAASKADAARAAALQVAAVKREPLMLPAPVEVVEIPGMNMIRAILEMPALSPVPVARQATITSA